MKKQLFEKTDEWKANEQKDKWMHENNKKQMNDLPNILTFEWLKSES